MRGTRHRGLAAGRPRTPLLADSVVRMVMVRLAVLLLMLVVIDVVCKEECAGLDGALSFTY